jgi:copper(I)-binding protein
MGHIIHRRGVLNTGFALIGSLLLPSAHACEFYSDNLTIIHPWTRASAHGATSAVVCMGFKDVVQSDRLIGATTELAEGAELGGKGEGRAIDFLVQEGQTPELSEAGVHLRLTGLKLPLEVGRQYPMTLVFEKTGPIPTQLTVEYTRFR